MLLSAIAYALRISGAGDYCPDCGRLVVFSWPIGEEPAGETCDPLSSPRCWTQPNGQFVLEPSARVSVMPPAVAEGLEPPALLKLAP